LLSRRTTNDRVNFAKIPLVTKPGWYNFASSCGRVGDFGLINLISCFLLLLSLWACGQRSCVVHMSTAMLRFALLSLRAGGALRNLAGETKENSEC
jgi:hypothetical protein